MLFSLPLPSQIVRNYHTHIGHNYVSVTIHIFSLCSPYERLPPLPSSPYLNVSLCIGGKLFENVLSL